MRRPQLFSAARALLLVALLVPPPLCSQIPASFQNVRSGPANSPVVPAPTAQLLDEIPWNILRARESQVHPIRSANDTLSFYKRKAEWKKIIDEYWGPGVPYAQKVAAFNTYADYIQAKFPCFEGLNLNWNSHRMAYATQITDSTSAGGFWAIVSHLAYALEDMHAFAYDDSALAASLPPAQGTPMLTINLNHSGYLGAGITPLPDSSLLVFKVSPNHPLGLQPGDIVLGYEGIPWHALVRELLAGGLPLDGSNSNDERARQHLLLQSAAPASILFDTLDVVKYTTGDTLHLPTAPLVTWQNNVLMMCNEQLPIPGVPMPNYDPDAQTGGTKFGVVEGTNIGYIYVTKHSLKTHDPNAGANLEFSNAVRALMNTDGLIIDMRYNIGGNWIQSLYQGFSLILNHDAYTIENWGRLSATDPVALVRTHDVGTETWHIKGDPNTVYDRPIAVLLGPRCRSMGDYTAYRMRFIPNARFFGKPTNGGFTGSTVWGPSVSGFTFWCPDRTVRDYSNPARILVRHGVPVDEEVWLTRDDVAKGDDTVVKRALGWITSVAHAHDVAASCTWLNAGTDTVRLTAVVENPNSHPISLMAYFKADSIVVDSAAFADDGLHGAGTGGDGVWWTSWIVPAGERFYSVATRVVDPEDTSTFPMPYAARFTTAGPIACVGDSAYAKPVWGRTVNFRLKFSNLGSSLSIPGVTAKIHALDTARSIVSSNPISIGDFAPGQTRLDNLIRIAFSGSSHGTQNLAYALEISSGGVKYWLDTLEIQVSDATGIAALTEIPNSYELRQNYPNPFNPSTTIEYALPRRSHVTLTVFNTLGQQIATLVEGEKEAGYHEVQLDASALSSGVYIYRLRAGDFVQSRKLVALK